MNSGIRDAYGLAWRLAWCLRSPSVPENLLVSYTAERRPHTRSMLKTSIAMGAFFALQNTFLAQIRNLLIKMLTTFVPPVRRFLRYMKFKPLPRYDGKDGNERTPSLEYREIVPNSGFFLESGGWMIPQVWIRGNEAPRRLDNVLFLVPSKDTKIRFVALAVFAFGNLDESFAGEILAGLQVVVDAIKPTTHDAVVLKAFGLALPRNGIKAIREDLLAIVADKSELPDGAASEGYDSERIHAEIGLTGSESNSNWLRILFPRAWVDWIVGANDQPTIKYLVLRPDRYVFSVSESLDELKCSLEKLFM